MIGSFVTSKAGHDKGTLYVVVAQDQKNVYLADGHSKKIDRPKKKSIKHIQPINKKTNSDLSERLRSKTQVRDEEIKYAIKCYANQFSV